MYEGEKGQERCVLINSAAGGGIYGGKQHIYIPLSNKIFHSTQRYHNTLKQGRR